MSYGRVLACGRFRYLSVCAARIFDGNKKIKPVNIAKTERTHIVRFEKRRSGDRFKSICALVSE